MNDATSKLCVKAAAAVIVLGIPFFCAHLEAVWSPPIIISSPTNDSRFQLSESAQDTTVVVWSNYDSGTSSDTLVSATYSAGVWSLPVVISSLAERVFDPVLVVDSNDNFVLVWGSVSSTGTKILSSVFPIGFSWSAPATVYTETTETIIFNSLEATTDDNGNTIVTWVTFDGTNFHVNSAVNSP